MLNKHRDVNPGHLCLRTPCVLVLLTHLMLLASLLGQQTPWPILPKCHGQLAMGTLKCSENAKTQPG